MYKRLSKVQAEVLYLLTQKFLKPDEIAKKRKVSREVTYKILRKLRDKGYITTFKIEDKKITRKKSLLNKLNSICYFCGHFDVVGHHLIRVIDNGLDEEANFLFLCPNCHSLIHHHDYRLRYLDGYYVMFQVKNDVSHTKPDKKQLIYKRPLPIASIKNAIAHKTLTL